MLPFPPRLRAPDYLSVNPLGTIPLLIDGATRITESVAACQFLAERHGPTSLVVRPDEADFGASLNWMSFGEATLTFPQAIVLRYRRFEAERGLSAVADDYARWFVSRLRAVDAALGEREFLCAGRFTVADISVGYALMLAEIGGFGERFSPTLLRYWQRLAERGAFRRAKDAQARAASEQGVDTAWPG